MYHCAVSEISGVTDFIFYFTFFLVYVNLDCIIIYLSLFPYPGMVEVEVQASLANCTTLKREMAARKRNW